jgi:hypothetical protein
MRSAAQALKLAFQATQREMATRAPKDRKVAILGAAGGIGQPLSLLMKVGRPSRPCFVLVGTLRSGSVTICLSARR